MVKWPHEPEPLPLVGICRPFGQQIGSQRLVEGPPCPVGAAARGEVAHWIWARDGKDIVGAVCFSGHPVEDIGHQATQPFTTGRVLDPIRIGARSDSHVEGQAVEHVSKVLRAAQDLGWG